MSFGGVEGRFFIFVQPHMPVLSVQEPQEYVRAEVESEDARAEVESVLGAWSDVLILLLFLSASLALLGAARLEERIRSLWSQPPMAARQHMHTHLHTTYAYTQRTVARSSKHWR